MSRVRELVRRLRSGGLAQDLAWGMVNEFVGLFSSLVSFVLLGKHLGPEGFGGYVAVYAVIGPISALSYAGLMLVILQHSLREREDPSEVASSCLSLTIVLAGIAVATCIAICTVVAPETELAVVALLAVAELGFFAVVQVAATLVQAYRGYAAAIKLRVIVPAVRSALVTGLFVTGRLELLPFAFLLVVANAVLAVVLMVRSVPALGIRFRFRRPRLAHLKTAFLFSAINSAQAVQENGDQAVLSATGFTRDTGLYAAAYRINQMCGLPIGVLMHSTHQRFLDHDERQRGQHVRRAVAFTKGAVALAVLAAIGIWICAPYFHVIFGKEYEETSHILRTLAVVLPILSFSIGPLNGLLGLGRTGTRALIVLCSSALSMALYVTLIPRISWRGGVWGTIVGDIFLSVAAWTALLVHQRRHDRAVERAEAEGEALVGAGTVAEAGA